MSIKKRGLEDTVENLDDLLGVGWVLYNRINKAFVSGYEKFNKKAINEDAFIQLANVEYVNWVIEVKGVLKKFKSIHYFFHFVEPRRVETDLPKSYPGEIGETYKKLRRKLYALEDIILHLKENLSLKIRREIAEIEHEKDILYKITYSEHTREIKLNSIVLAKPDFDSENDNFFNYVFNNPGKILTKEKIEGDLKRKIKKKLSEVVKDLGFKGNVKTIFFPGVKKDKIMFKNPITKLYAIKNDLPVLNFSKIGKK